MKGIIELTNNIQNGINKKLVYINCKKSILNIEILKILQKESIITGFSIGKYFIKVNLNLKIKNLKFKNLSKPSNYVYSKLNKINLTNQGTGLIILSTSNGFISDHFARISKKGGKLICKLI